MLNPNKNSFERSLACEIRPDSNIQIDKTVNNSEQEMENIRSISLEIFNKEPNSTEFKTRQYEDILNKNLPVEFKEKTEEKTDSISRKSSKIASYNFEEWIDVTLDSLFQNNEINSPLDLFNRLKEDGFGLFCESEHDELSETLSHLSNVESDSDSDFCEFKVTAQEEAEMKNRIKEHCPNL